jgi:hypothetical protein
MTLTADDLYNFFGEFREPGVIRPALDHQSGKPYRSLKTNTRALRTTPKSRAFINIHTHTLIVLQGLHAWYLWLLSRILGLCTAMILTSQVTDRSDHGILRG